MRPDWTSATLAGFGLGMAVIASGFWLIWPIAAFAVGGIHRRQRLAAWFGLLLSIVAWVAFQAGLTDPPPFEDTFAARQLTGYATAIGAQLSASLALWVGARTFEGGTRLAKGTAWVGIAASIGLIGTLAVVIAVPAGSSFEIPLSAAWRVIPRDEVPRHMDLAFGEDFTAVFGSITPPPEDGRRASVPVIGVSVVREASDARGCLQALDVWAPPPTQLYDAEIVSSSDIELHAGEAFETVRTVDPGGHRLHAFGLARTRWVGLLREPLCYIVAISVPAGASFSEADVATIMASFRYR